MDCSTPDLPVSHHLPEFAQVHVHCVGDAIQPYHPLTPSSLSAFNLPSIRVFSNESCVRIKWAKYWSFISLSNEYLGLTSLKIDWFDLFAVQGTLRSLLSTTVQRHQFIRFLLPTSKYSIISALHRSLYKCDFSSPVNFPPAYPILILLIIHMDSSMDLWLKPLPHGINSI